MEALLNVVWLLMALAAIGYCWRRWSSPEGKAEHRGAFYQRWVALGCGLVLLFFVISLTDDLHPELANLEDSSSSKRVLAGWARLHTAGSCGKQLAHHGSAILPKVLFQANAVVLDRIVPAEILPPALVSLCPAPSRAPPSLPL